ncbi:MAG: hypothetical protein JST12_14775 [Armatimonadetes bacterium]|nr:hypothetical protein [Armatimonadota bacterium]
MLLSQNGTGVQTPSPATISDFQRANEVVATAAFQANVAAQLGAGGDIVIIGDSIFAGTGDNEPNSVQNWLHAGLRRKYSNPSYETGFGFYPVTSSVLGSAYAAASGEPNYYHPLDFTGTPTSENYYYLRVRRSPGTAGAKTRFSFPAVMPDGTKIKKIELVVSTYATTGPNTALSFTVDAYSVAAPLSSGDATITAGTASSITHNGLQGVTQVYDSTNLPNSGNISNGPRYRTGLLPITFDGATHNPVVQVTTDQDMFVEGVILYCDDWDPDGKGVRIHRICGSGNQLLPQRSTQTAGSPDRWAFNSLGFMAWYRSWIHRFGFSGTSASYETKGPSCRAKLFILELTGINDQLVNNSGPFTIGQNLINTVDAALQTNSAVSFLLAIPYCPGSTLCDPWRTGYGTGTTNGADGTVCSWTSLTWAAYALQAKYPDRVAVVNKDIKLGQLKYADAIVAKGWNTADFIHWKNGGPPSMAQDILSILPNPTPFPISIALASSTITQNITTAIRFDRFDKLKNWGSSHVDYDVQTIDTTLANRPSRSSDNLSVQFNETFGRNIGGYAAASNMVAPQGDFTVFVRLYLTQIPYSGQSYKSLIYGDDGGSAVAWGLYLGYSASSANALKPLAYGSTATGCTSAISLSAWQTIAVVRSGSTVTYYINGVAANSGTATTPSSSPSTRFIGGPNPSGAVTPLPAGTKISHLLEASRAMTADEIASLHTNPDQVFVLA